MFFCFYNPLNVRRKQKTVVRCKIIDLVKYVTKQFPKPKESKKNMTVSMFVMFLNGLVLMSEGNQSAAIPIPSCFNNCKPRDSNELWITNLISKIPKHKIIWKDVLPTPQRYFLQIVSLKSAIFYRQLRDNCSYGMKEGPCAVKTTNDYSNCCNQMKKFMYVVGRTKNVDFSNPDWAVIQYILFSFYKSKVKETSRAEIGLVECKEYIFTKVPMLTSLMKSKVHCKDKVAYPVIKKLLKRWKGYFKQKLNKRPKRKPCGKKRKRRTVVSEKDAMQDPVFQSILEEVVSKRKKT